MTPRILLPFVLAPALAWGQSELPEHIHINVAVSVSSAQAAAVVTVGETKGSQVALKVDEQVLGELPAEVQVQTAGLYSEDLAPGTKLLVFFRKRSANRWVHTGQYELITHGTIRQVPQDVYLRLVRERGERVASSRTRTTGS
jgi:hypothetical protein